MGECINGWIEEACICWWPWCRIIVNILELAIFSLSLLAKEGFSSFSFYTLHKGYHIVTVLLSNFWKNGPKKKNPTYMLISAKKRMRVNIPLLSPPLLYCGWHVMRTEYLNLGPESFLGTRVRSLKMLLDSKARK